MNQLPAFLRQLIVNQLNIVRKAKQAAKLTLCSLRFVNKQGDTHSYLSLQFYLCANLVKG